MKPTQPHKFLFVISTFLTLVTTSTLALADIGCSTVPKSKFQDRAKLDDILKPKGLMINKIIDDHGCYKVVAVTRQFKTIILRFNAETLKPVDETASKRNSTQSTNAEFDGN